jgi:chaperonin GroEL
MRASHSTNEFAGDGTTTSAVLVNSILKEGIKVVENGAHPMLVKEGMDIATEKIKEYIQKVAVPLSSNSQLHSICNVSSNYDNEIADCVSKVLSEVGIEANVEFDISLDNKTYSEV